MGSTEDFERRMRRQFHEPRLTSGLVVSTCIFVGGTWHMLVRERGVRELLFSVLVLWFTYLGSVLLHELGHALVARAVNLRPITLIAGTGPRVRGRVAGIALNLGMVPAGGLVQVVSETLQPKLRWRLLAVYAAGPTVSLALWWIGYVPFGHHWTALMAGSDAWIRPGAALVIVNFLFVLSSANPLSGRGDVGTPTGDIAQIALLPRLHQAQVNALVLAAEVTEVLELMALEHYAAAFEAARRHVSVSPGNWIARLQLGTLFLLARDYDAAFRELVAIRSEPALIGEAGLRRVGALFANNYAWACYMLEDAALLDDADRASAEAHRQLPNAASILGTRGAVLVARGRVEEGTLLLKRALKLQHLRAHKATNLVGLALAALQQGQRKNARRLLGEAKELDPDCELLGRGQRELDVAEKRRARPEGTAVSPAIIGSSD
jgi:hypothetical protein